MFQTTNQPFNAYDMPMTCGYFWHRQGAQQVLQAFRHGIAQREDGALQHVAGALHGETGPVSNQKSGSIGII